MIQFLVLEERYAKKKPSVESKGDERREGGSNDAFTFKSYFNSCLRLERRGKHVLRHS